MESEPLDSLLLSSNLQMEEGSKNKSTEYYLEQYRVYLHIFNDTNDRRQKANEFFLGLNTAIMGVLGYLEAKEAPHNSIIFALVPFVGAGICSCWYSIIHSFKQLNRAKFKVIHMLESKLPAQPFAKEWEILGQEKNRKKYHPISKLEKHIPIIFTLLYVIFILSGVPWKEIYHLLLK
ncbi:MAG: hypothetical protein V4439_00560 [Patescibacteria group bacterium]